MPASIYRTFTQFCGVCQKSGNYFSSWNMLCEVFCLLKRQFKVDPLYLFFRQMDAFAPSVSFRKKNVAGLSTKIPLIFSREQSWRFYMHSLHKYLRKAAISKRNSLSLLLYNELTAMLKLRQCFYLSLLKEHYADVRRSMIFLKFIYHRYKRRPAVYRRRRKSRRFFRKMLRRRRRFFRFSRRAFRKKSSLLGRPNSKKKIVFVKKKLFNKKRKILQKGGNKYSKQIKKGNTIKRNV